jgi:hypothetical protein
MGWENTESGVHAGSVAQSNGQRERLKRSNKLQIQTPNTKQAPSSKFQAPRKFRTAKPYGIAGEAMHLRFSVAAFSVCPSRGRGFLPGWEVWGFAVWSFFGFWILDFGVSDWPLLRSGRRLAILVEIAKSMKTFNRPNGENI